MRTPGTLTPDPDEIEPAPSGPKPKSLKITTSKRSKQITMREVRDAAARLGMEVISVDTINGYKVLGDYVEQCGAIPIGRSMLLTAYQHLSKGLIKCDELLSLELGVEATTMLLQSLQGLASAQIKAANSLIESDKRADSMLDADQPTVLPPPPMQTVVPIRDCNVTIMAEGSKPKP